MKRRWQTLPTSHSPACDNREPARAVPARTWVICVLLLLATVLNYLDRQVLSLTAERVMAEFHLDRRGFGELVSSFRYSYAFVQLFGGWLVDAAGPEAPADAAASNSAVSAAGATLIGRKSTSATRSAIPSLMPLPTP